MKWVEGRVALPFLGQSKAGLRRIERADNKARRIEEKRGEITQTSSSTGSTSYEEEKKEEEEKEVVV